MNISRTGACIPAQQQRLGMLAASEEAGVGEYVTAAQRRGTKHWRISVSSQSLRQNQKLNKNQVSFPGFFPSDTVKLSKF